MEDIERFRLPRQRGSFLACTNPSLLLLERPPFAILSPHELIQLWGVRDLHVRTVPFQAPPRRSQRQDAQEYDLRERARIIEVREWSRTTLARCHPFLVMTDRARQGLRILLRFLVQFTWQQLRHATMRGVIHLPLAADVQYTVVGQPLARRHARWSRRH